MISSLNIMLTSFLHISLQYYHYLFHHTIYTLKCHHIKQYISITILNNIFPSPYQTIYFYHHTKQYISITILNNIFPSPYQTIYFHHHIKQSINQRFRTVFISGKYIFIKADSLFFDILLF